MHRNWIYWKHTTHWLCREGLKLTGFITAISTLLSPITEVRRADTLTIAAQESSTATGSYTLKSWVRKSPKHLCFMTLCFIVPYGVLIKENLHIRQTYCSWFHRYHQNIPQLTHCIGRRKRRTDHQHTETGKNYNLNVLNKVLVYSTQFNFHVQCICVFALVGTQSKFQFIKVRWTIYHMYFHSVSKCTENWCMLKVYYTFIILCVFPRGNRYYNHDVIIM